MYGAASAAERQAVHRRLVPLVADPEEHALHLGRGTVEPDESVAATLEATANPAGARGHPEVAAELAEHSERLTPARRVDDQGRRIRTAASFLYAAGHVDIAVEAGERASRLARASGGHWIFTRSELAFRCLYLSEGREAAALDHLLPLLDERAGIRLHPTLVARTLANAIEALVRTGELVQSDSLAGRLEEHAHALSVPSAIASAARCRALVLAQSGDIPAARASIEVALAAHERLREPLELARTYLAQGAIERRAKQKAEARATLRRAEAIFAELGARLWLERARRDIARTGLTRSLDRELSPTERRVAELAAAGARNKEIAGALFVSVKSVEANLSRVYREARDQVAGRARRPTGQTATT